jgi:Protein of unknown function (DUF3617)
MHWVNGSCLLLAGAMAVAAFPAYAADHLKPGQWEVAVKVGQKGGPQIPPEQLEQMKKMGITLPFGGQAIMTSQCITPEMASSDKPFANDERDPNKCQVTNYKRVGSKATGEMVCTGDFKGSGAFEMTMDSETEYHGGWTVKGVSSEAGPVEQTTELHGKWTATTCAATSN